MKVTVATGLYPPEIGGPATYVRMLEETLSDKVDLSVVPFGWVRHYPKGIRHFVYTWKLWQASIDADIVYALDPVSVGLPAKCVARLRGVPLMLRLGGDYAWEQGRLRYGVTLTLDEFVAASEKQLLFVRMLQWIQTSVAKAADKVVVPSEYLKSVVEQWGIPSEKIAVIYSALYPLEVSGTKAQLKSQLALPGRTIVTAGRLVPWKGVSVLLEVVDRLRHEYDDITCVVIGDGEERAELEKKVKLLRLQDVVRFTGSVSKDTLGALIKAGDVFVLNTAYEGLSHQLIEVMDIGTPIVTTAAGGNTELIEDGIHGYLVEFNDPDALHDAIRRVFEHPESGERMVQSARGRSKDFTKQNVSEAVTQLFSELV